MSQTVSESAILVIAGVIPVALLTKESQAVHGRKSEVDKPSAAKEKRCHSYSYAMADILVTKASRKMDGKSSRELIESTVKLGSNSPNS